MLHFSWQARNEELARKSAKASEEDIKQLTEEMEARLGASERKVYALTKEREMLRRGNEKLASANDLLKEKDNIIAQVTRLLAARLAEGRTGGAFQGANGRFVLTFSLSVCQYKPQPRSRRGAGSLSHEQVVREQWPPLLPALESWDWSQVMAEGEQLSKKQLAQESTIKKLRQQLKEAEISRKELAAEAAAERSKVEETLEARQKAETDLAAAWAAHKTELEAEKGHYESLVARARSAQVTPENLPLSL